MIGSNEDLFVAVYRQKAEQNRLKPGLAPKQAIDLLASPHREDLIDVPPTPCFANKWDSGKSMTRFDSVSGWVYRNQFDSKDKQILPINDDILVSSNDWKS